MRKVIALAVCLAACSQSAAVKDPIVPAADAATPDVDVSDAGEAAAPPDAAALAPDAAALAPDAAALAPDAPPATRGDRVATPISVSIVGDLSGIAVHDVAIDGARGLWATTDRFVEYIPAGKEPRHYTAGDGLAGGDAMVKLTAVGAGLPGQAFIGSAGKYVDVVDVESDGSLRVHHVAITDPVHVAKITTAMRFTVDLGAAYGGTVWIGAEHGVAAIHGIADGYCWGTDGCFEEHRHPDPSGNPTGDVKGVAVCPNHDMWSGDEKWLARMPYGARGTTPDFWAVPPDGYPLPLIDAFPGAPDEIAALVCDGAGTLWVGSFGSGLLHYDPGTMRSTYHDATTALPQDLVTALAEDPTDGSIWVGTSWKGLARLRAGAWTYYDSTAGLPSDSVTALAVDERASPRTVYIATASGLYAFSGD